MTSANGSGDFNPRVSPMVQFMALPASMNGIVPHTQIFCRRICRSTQGM